MQTPELQLIREISQIIAEATDYRDGLRRSASRIAGALGIEDCSIMVYEEALDRLALHTSSSTEPSRETAFHMAADQGIVGYTFRTRQPIRTEQMSEHPEFSSAERIWSDPFGAFISVPLVIGGRTIGVMTLASRNCRQLPPRVSALAEALSPPLSMFIHNAQLAGRSGRRAPARQPRVERILSGTPITDGTVSGRAYTLVGTEVLRGVAPEYARDPDAERHLFEKALDQARRDTEDLQQEAGNLLAEVDASIFYVHALLLEDPTLIQRVQELLDQGFALGYSLARVAQRFDSELEELNNQLMRERAADLRDVILRLYQAAERLAKTDADKLETATDDIPNRPVAVARELLPSQLIRLPLSRLAGIVCEQGGTTAHAAILARAMRIPMVTGVTDALRAIQPGDPLILDCATGHCYVRPTAAVIRRFRPALRYHRHRDRVAPATTCELSHTQDGANVELAGNISLVSELPLLERYQAAGVGLYRTEFMFMVRGTYPSEEEQYRVFRQIVEACRHTYVTLRLLDIGGDKPLAYVDFSQEMNPFLGWRGIRFLLSNIQLLEPHLRAILRTTSHGCVRILLPMVADLGELLATREVIGRVEKELRAEGVELGEYQLGVMLELPSTVWALPAMVPHIDFVSIGTNDLTQYTLAVDRGNERVSRWFRPLHPVVLRIVKHTADVLAGFPGKKLALCGEIAGSSLAAPFLVGSGLRELSMNPWKIPELRQTLARFTVTEAEELVARVLNFDTADQVEQELYRFAEDHGYTEAVRTGH